VLNEPGYAQTHCASAQVDFDAVGYMHHIEERVKSHWPASGHEKKSRVAIQFKIMPNGRIEDVLIQRASGNAKADKIALRAVINSAPFHPLPVVGASGYFEIRFVFDTQAFSTGMHGTYISG